MELMPTHNRALVTIVTIVLMSVVAVGGYLLWPALNFFLAVSQHGLVRDRVTFSIPGSTTEIVHSRIGAAMCEYHRDVSYRNGAVPERTTPLKYDTARGYPINVYMIQSGENVFLRFDDAVAEHLLDIQAQKTFLVVNVDKQAFIGELNDESDNYGWSMTNGDRSTQKVHVGGQRATPMTELTGDGPDVYLGQLTGRTGDLHFLPASAAPKANIDYLYPEERIR